MKQCIFLGPDLAGGLRAKGIRAHSRSENFLSLRCSISLQVPLPVSLPLFLPSCLPAFQSHLHRVRLLPTNLVCLSYLLFSSSSSVFWNKRNDLVTNLCMLCLLFLASDFSFIPQYICQFYVSTWLSHEVPRYLVKHYLRCFCGYFWVRLTFKSVEWLKLPHMWMGLIQSVGGLNRAKRLIPPSVRILLVWLPLDTETYVWYCSLLAFGRELHHHLS